MPPSPNTPRRSDSGTSVAEAVRATHNTNLIVDVAGVMYRAADHDVDSLILARGRRRLMARQRYIFHAGVETLVTLEMDNESVVGLSTM